MSDIIKKEQNFSLSLPIKEKLFTSNTIKELQVYNPDLIPMIKTIQDNLPYQLKHASLFGKHQSSFMNSLMTIHTKTPLRSIRQALAEIEQIKASLAEHNIKSAKNENKIQLKEVEMLKLQKKLKRLEARFESKDPEVLEKMSDKEFDEYLDEEITIQKLQLEIQKLEIDIAKVRSQQQDGSLYVSGAIRRMADYTAQIESLKKHYNIDEFSEEAFEKEESAYHIMTAFEQGMTAARARSDGLVDEGNKIYFSNLGINGYVAQKEIDRYFAKEKLADAEYELFNKYTNNPESLNPQEKAYLKSIDDGVVKPSYDFKQPDYAMYIGFIEEMIEKFKDCPEKKAKMFGLNTFSEIALLSHGDNRFDKQESKDVEE